VLMGSGGYSDKTIIAKGLTFLSLFGLDYSDGTRDQNASHAGRGVHQNQYVDRVSIIGERRWYKAEFEREDAACGHYVGQFEYISGRIVIELDTASARRLDHHI
jgi:hypothetical protein